VLRRSRWCRTSCARRAAAEATGLPGWPAAYAACCARVRASAGLWERRLVGAPPSARCGDRSSAASLRGRSSHTLSRPCPGPVEVVKSLVLMGEPCLCGSASSLWERRPRRDAATDQALHRCEGAAPTLPSRLCPGPVEMIKSLVFVGAPPSARCGDRSSAASLRGRSSHTPQPALPRVCRNDEEPCLCGSAALGAMHPPIERCIAARAQLPPL